MEIDDKKIGKLSDLARIKLGDEEKKELSKDIESVLSYVSEIQKVSLDIAKKGSPLSQQRATLCNVMREDESSHESGLYTEKILDEAPQREENYIKVKKIL